MELIGLNRAIKTFAGMDVIVSVSPVKGQPPTEETLTAKTVLLNCLGTTKVDSGKEAIMVYTLGSRIYAADNEVTLDDDDMLILKKAVEHNAPNYVPMIQGQVLMLLNEQTCTR